MSFAPTAIARWPWSVSTRTARDDGDHAHDVRAARGASALGHLFCDRSRCTWDGGDPAPAMRRGRRGRKMKRPLCSVPSPLLLLQRLLVLPDGADRSTISGFVPQLYNLLKTVQVRMTKADTRGATHHNFTTRVQFIKQIVTILQNLIY